MYFQMVDNQVLSTQGQLDVNLHRLTELMRATPREKDTTASTAPAE